MRIHTGVTAMLIGTILLFSVGCTPSGPDFVDAGVNYTAETAVQLLESSDAGDLADEPAADAEALRQQALTHLRRRGGRARDAARFITRTFPKARRGVPYYVERAMYEGTECWVIVEASGRTDGPLSERRLWVMDTEGGVRLFSSR